MTWQVGDLAVCVDAAARPGFEARIGFLKLEQNRVYCISAVLLPPDGLVHLLVNDEPPHISPRWGSTGWNPDRFRKVVRDKHEQCEPEFVTLLKRIKRKQPA